MSVADLMMGRANDAGVMGLASDARQMFAHLNAGHGRRESP